MKNPVYVIVGDWHHANSVDEAVLRVLRDNRNLPLLCLGDLIGPELVSSTSPVTPLAVEGNVGKLP